jgi:sterol desaturase/sphingolipid hydroxylase (fatty acid hydroxylase superfamily)
MAKHYVSNEDVSQRMFRSELLEALTHVRMLVPHFMFVPVVGYMFYAAYRTGLGIAALALLFLAGLALWSLVEYVMHRWVFHVGKEIEDETREVLERVTRDDPAVPLMRGFTQTRYFLAHGVHHDFPSDSQRLVLAPSVSIPLALLFYFGFKLAFGASAAPMLFAGLVVGYLVYDTIHYAVHHFRMRSRLGLYLKKHHFRHHYQNSEQDFGVSSPLWDLVFGTLGRRDRATR